MTRETLNEFALHSSFIVHGAYIELFGEPKLLAGVHEDLELVAGDPEDALVVLVGKETLVRDQEGLEGQYWLHG